MAGQSVFESLLEAAPHRSPETKTKAAATASGKSCGALPRLILSVPTHDFSRQLALLPSGLGTPLAWVPAAFPGPFVAPRCGVTGSNFGIMARADCSATMAPLARGRNEAECLRPPT